MDTPGIDIRPLRHINGTAEFAEVFFTDVVVPRENLVGELNGGWAITQGSLAHERAGLWVEGVARLEQTVQGSSSSPSSTGRGRRPDHPAQDRRSRTSWRRACARSATRASRRSRRARRAPEHSYMKMATSEAGKAAFELGMEICGPFGAVTDPTLGRGRRAAGCTASSCRFANTIAGGSSRDPAQHHRPARARPPEALRHDAWTSRSPPTRSCCATPRSELLERECPPALAARAHRRPRRRTTPLWRHLREFAALGTGRLRPTSACSSSETGYVAAPGPFFATAALAHAARSPAIEHRPALDRVSSASRPRPSCSRARRHVAAERVADRSASCPTPTSPT